MKVKGEGYSPMLLCKDHDLCMLDFCQSQAFLQPISVKQKLWARS